MLARIIEGPSPIFYSFKIRYLLLSLFCILKDRLPLQLSKKLHQNFQPAVCVVAIKG